MYERIKTRPSLNHLYAEKLLKEGLIQKEAVEQMEALINQCLEEAFQTVRGSACPFPQPRFYENWKGFHGTYSHAPVPTGVERKKLIGLSRKMNSLPSDYTFHPKILSLLKKRQEAIEKGNGIDWANAEALAFASLLMEGTPVRLSGQDSGRGTFSQRHSVLVDTKTEKRYIPLNALAEHQARFSVFDSMLAEAGILGFDYGYAMAQPEGLVIWEAQFGDFVNNAQGIVDLYIVSGESKWQRLNGLVMLLPHGLEGLGPEHSSARPERFLQLCAEDNIQVCNPTTPAQYFHLLRRQMKRNFRKPLVVLSPKSLLRHPQAVSRLTAMSSGFFQEVLDDDMNLKSPRRIILCSGKIYYDLIKRREELKNKKTLILRFEQLYPLPEVQLKKRVAQFRKTKEWCWVQEEPENMGAWSFMRPFLESVIGGPIQYIGRKAASSPATGFPNVFRQEQAAVINQAVGPV
jgi:2-oxoglutarate dehydrogenase E1 component